MHTDKHGFLALRQAQLLGEFVVPPKRLVSVSIGVHPWLNFVF